MCVARIFIVLGVGGISITTLAVVYERTTQTSVRADDVLELLKRLFLGLLYSAVGMASLWVASRRLERVADRPDRLQRIITALSRPTAVKWMLSSCVALTLALVLAAPWLWSLDNLHVIREHSGVVGLEHLREVRGGGVDFLAIETGRLAPDDVDAFIAANALSPDPSGTRLRSMSTSEPGLMRWEKHWPEHPEWYSSLKPVPRNTCRTGCEALCLVDRRSGRVWVAYQEPDFSGD
jgi:hypothetical protein